MNTKAIEDLINQKLNLISISSFLEKLNLKINQRFVYRDFQAPWNKPENEWKLEEFNTIILCSINVIDNLSNKEIKISFEEEIKCNEFIQNPGLVIINLIGKLITHELHESIKYNGNWIIDPHP